MIAWRYLRARRAEGFISVISGFSIAGIALGVATLIVVTAVMNGVRGEMLKHFLGWGGHIAVYGNAAPLDHYDALLDKLKAMDGVTAAVPVIEGQVMASHKGQALGAQATAFRNGDFKNKRHILDHIIAGDAQAFMAGEGVIIGSRMAAQLGIRLGDTLTLISPQGRATVAGLVPRIKSYHVVALFEFGMYALDSGLVLMPFGEAQLFFKLADAGGDRVTGIEVNAADPDGAPAIADAIRRGTGLRVYDWRQSHEGVFSALEVQRTVMFLILTLIILVAAFNIVSGLIMLVKDKGPDIAILRTMGASRGTVLRIFMLTGASIGAAGTAAGVALGLPLAWHVDDIRVWLERVTGQRLLGEKLYFLATMPAEVNMGEVAAIVLMSLLLSFLATLYPARRAARLDPAEALRYE